MKDHPQFAAVWPGQAYPLGATWDGEGVNFALFSEHAESVELCLFDASGRRELQRIRLRERTDHVWHCYLPEARPGLVYGYRVDGPYKPDQGHRFNPHKLLVDPYARDLVGSLKWSDAVYGFAAGQNTDGPSFDQRDSAPYVPKARVIDASFAWDDDRRPQIPMHATVIYEVHVRGFTMMHPELPKALRGTYAALCSGAVIDYLKQLGVTTLELMPVHAYIDERRLIELGLRNFWGYNPLAFSAPEGRYSNSGKVDEFKTMVKTLHRAGLEVIMDVVYNHTCEVDHLGPTLSFRGIDNAAYYRLDPGQPRLYSDFTGCGNTLNLDHPRVLQLVMDSLRYWAEEMHVDGFRFDLATALARERGGFEPMSAFFRAVRQDPVLNRVKLIAEPWDLGAEGYRAGNFPPGWSEWNDRYRDGMRAYWKGDGGVIGEFARRLSGSSDLYGRSRHGPQASINFICAHDGFALQDLVSCNDKHNDANLEDNRDGHNGNLSWNCGAEGPTEDPVVRALRERQKRNFLATLFLSQGVPMLLAGDERGRTQSGNNNAYCQDNEIGWLDWTLDEERSQLLQFTRRMIMLRRSHPSFRRRDFFQGRPVQDGNAKDIQWLKPDGTEMTDREWEHDFARCLGGYLAGGDMNEVDRLGQPLRDDDFLILCNAHHEDVPFAMPNLEGDSWRALIDTWSAAEFPDARRYEAGQTYLLRGRSLALLTRAPIGVEMRDPLIRLAARYGIDAEYHDLWGGRHEVSDENLIVLLGQFGVDASTPEKLRAALDAAEQRPALPPVALIEPDAATHRIGLQSALQEKRLRARVQAEDGRMHEFEVRQPEPQSIEFDVLLPMGYHRIELLGAEGTLGKCLLIAAPPRCWEAPVFAPVFPQSSPQSSQQDIRLWGTAVQLYSLRSSRNWGIGDFGDLQRLVEQFAALGAGAVGLNPLHALFPHNPHHISPYSPSSRIALNVLYLEIETIEDYRESKEARGLVRSPAFRARLAELRRIELVDYPGVSAAKFEVLEQLYQHFRQAHLLKGSRRGAAFRAFQAERGRVLRQHALHEALQEAFQRADPAVSGWQVWPEAYRDANGQAAARFAEEHIERVEFYEYLQWQAELQIARVNDSCRSLGLGIGLYVDLSVSVDRGGSDAWAYRDCYATEASVGAPPDEFNLNGQDWGLPPLRPDRLRESGYQPYIEALRAGMRRSGALRIDHVMGLMRVYWVPPGASPREGAYVHYPVEEMLAILALESQRNRCVVIGEDLGTVPDAMREHLSRYGILSYRLLIFEREQGGEFKPPEAYPRDALVALSTHDLPTLCGWWIGRDIELRRELKLYQDPASLDAQVARRAQDRSRLIHALQHAGLWPAAGAIPEAMTPDLAQAVHVYLARTPATLMMVQLEDALGIGEQANLPGTILEHPNWQRKLTLSVEGAAADRRMVSLAAALSKVRPHPAPGKL